VATLAVVTVALAATLRPDLWFRTSTLSGGDLGAHVWAAGWLHDHLFGGFWTWSSAWFAGFVPWSGYFPGAFFFAAVLGFVVPMGVALRLVLVASVLGLPWAAWGFGRLARLPFPIPPLLAVATVPFMLDRFQVAEGGNLLSTFAGEVNYALALSMTLLLWGVATRGVHDGRRRGIAALLVAGILVTHLVVALYAAVGLIAILCLSWSWRGLRWMATMGGVGLALSAAYLLPFVAHLGLTTTEGQKVKDTAYLAGLFPFARACPAPRPVAPTPQWVPRFGHTCGFSAYYSNQTGHLPVVVLLALAGLTYAVIKRREPGRRALLALAAAGAVTAVAFVLIGEATFWNGRLLPFWYLTLYLLAATGVAELALQAQVSLGRRLRRIRSTMSRSSRGRQAPPPPTWVARAAPLVCLAAVALALGPAGGLIPGVHADDPHDAPRVLPNFIAYDLSGYQAKAAWPEYHGVMETMKRVGATHGCGRAYADLGGHRNIAAYGSDWAMYLLPYWTENCITSADGLYVESSATSPDLAMVESELAYIHLNPKRELPYQPFSVTTGVRHLRLLGVRYYLALDDAAKAEADRDPELRLLAMSGSWKIYEIAGSSLVEGLGADPIVLRGLGSGKRDWLGAAIQTYLAAARSPGASGTPLYTTGGPAAWPRAPVAHSSVPGGTVDRDIAVSPAAQSPVDAARVSNVVYRNGHIAFDVDRVGAPVLMRESWYPDWHAQGAKGPWRITPNFMVVVPTSHHVVLDFGPDRAGILGLLVSVAGLMSLGLLWLGNPLTPSEPGPTVAAGSGGPDGGRQG
jgi:hypothetical protein